MPKSSDTDTHIYKKKRAGIMTSFDKNNYENFPVSLHEIKGIRKIIRRKRLNHLLGFFILLAFLLVVFAPGRFGRIGLFIIMILALLIFPSTYLYVWSRCPRCKNRFFSSSGKWYMELKKPKPWIRNKCGYCGLKLEIKEEKKIGDE